MLSPDIALSFWPLMALFDEFIAPWPDMLSVFAGAFALGLCAGLPGAIASVDIEEFDMLVVLDMALDFIALPSAIAAPPSIRPAASAKMKVFMKISLTLNGCRD